MENDHSELFNSEGLSFDSTLEGLVDVDYALDDKSFPFDTAYGLPSDILMSAQNTIGSDVSFLDGGATEGNNIQVEVSVGREFNISSEDGVKIGGDEVGEKMEVMVDAASTSGSKTNIAENKVPRKNESAVVQKDENEVKSSGKSGEKAKDSGRKSEHSRKKHSHSDRDRSKRSESRHSEHKKEKVEISIEIKEKPSGDEAANYASKDQRKESTTKRKAGAEDMMIDTKAINKCPFRYKTEKMDVNSPNASVVVSTDISVNMNESSIEPPAKRMKTGQSETSNDKVVENEMKLSDQNSLKTAKQSQSSRDETKTKERKSEKDTKESHNKTDQNRKESKTSSHKSSGESGHSSKPKSKEDSKSGIKSSDSKGKDEKSFTDTQPQIKQNESKSSKDKSREKSHTSDLKLKEQKDRRPSSDKVIDQNSEHIERRPSTEKSSSLKGEHKERRPSKDTAGKEGISNSSQQSKTKEKESKSSKEKLDKKINSSNDKPVEPLVKQNENTRQNVEVSLMIVDKEKIMNDLKDKQSKLVEKQKINKDKHVEKDLNEEKKKVLVDLQQQLKTLAKLTSKTIPEVSPSSKSEPPKNIEETTKDKTNQSSKVSKQLPTHGEAGNSKDYKKLNPSGEKSKPNEISEQIVANQKNPNVDHENDGQGLKNASSVTDKKAIVNAFKQKIELENELFSAAIGHDLSLSTSGESESSSSDRSTGTVVGKSDSSLNESLETHEKRKEEIAANGKERSAVKGDASGRCSKREGTMGDFNVGSKNLAAEFDNNSMNDSKSSDSDAQKEITDNKDIEEMDIASEDMHNDIPTNEGFLEFVTSDIEKNLNKKIQENNMTSETNSDKPQFDNTSDKNYMDNGFENVEYSESDTDKDLSRDFGNNDNEMNVDTEDMKMEDDGKDGADKPDGLDRADLESIDSYDDILTAEDYGEDMEEDFELDDDELHGWLEEGVTKESKNVKKRPEDLKEGEYISTEKPILEEKGSNLFDVLPKGWIMLSHNCGMPVYLHKESRVITLSRPYYIGTGSARKHDVPLSSVPCLLYRRELAKEEKANEEKASNTEQANTTSETQNADEGIAGMPKMTVRSANEAQQTETVTPEDLNKYCRGLFKFNMVEVKRFKTWREKRAHLITEKKKKDVKLPQMAPDTKLLTCQIPDNNVSKKKKKEFVLNPEGKTGVCILHEYTQNVLRQKPTYEFEEIQHAEFPFQATVLLNGIKYGSGIASSKKNAKNEAAKATLRIFFPEITSFWSDTQSRDNDPDKGLEFFKDIAIDDPRIPDLCTKSSLPQPYQVLHVCLKRNFGLGDTSFKVDKKTLSSQKTEFTLTVGKRTCTVVGKNKREAKQRASQGMLQQLHPELKNWAAIHRLYGNIISIDPMKKDDVFSLDEFNQNRNEKKKNFELLEKLKLAMRKVKENQMNEVNVVSSTISQASSVSL